MRANYHTHTKRCGHADGSEREYIEAAIENGIQILGFSDHAPYTFGDGYANHIRMGMNELEEYIGTLSELKKEYAKDIQIHIGLEMEYFPQFFDETYEKLKDGTIYFNDIEEAYNAVNTRKERESINN